MTSPIEGLISKQDIVELEKSEQLLLDDKDTIGVLEAVNSIDVQACPGSGKTTLIAAKLMLLAKKWPFDGSGVCVLSHTNVAKDEIINRLKKSKTREAQNLLAYPHFIGTIQEFVGKYIAFPSLRSKGIKVNFVDTELCVNLIRSKLQRGTREYVKQKSRYTDVLYNFDLYFEGGKIKVEVPTFPNHSISNSYKDLLNTRISLIREGCFFYRDVFTFARHALFNNAALVSAIQRRFPLVFLDEMQDTQMYQDELLRSIFGFGYDDTVVQRFGDPDQMIFQGMGGDEPNDSFNGKSAKDMDFVIYKSHRFPREIAEQISKLSYNAIPLESKLIDGRQDECGNLPVKRSDFKNTVIIYTDDNILSVVPTFLDFMLQCFTDEYVHSDEFTVKIVGAVGNEVTKDGQLKIAHYWPEFDKGKSTKSFQEMAFIDAVHHSRQRTVPDWTESYNFLLKRIVALLSYAGILDRNEKCFSSTTLREHLHQLGEWEEFGALIYEWLNPSYELNKDSWDRSILKLGKLLHVNSAFNHVAEYVAFSTPQNFKILGDVMGTARKSKLTVLPGNVIQHPAGFTAEISTIHGVKGETHDATLILETRNHICDLGVMLPYLTRARPTEDCPNSNLGKDAKSRRANKQFMRQLYVAMSRPKHLLCFAVHGKRIEEEQELALKELGWRIERL